MWLSPFYKSPQRDAGYDVADYCQVDPLFGTLADFDLLMDKAASLGLRVIIDLVPNHCSDQHVLFQSALAAAPGSPEREMFIFRDGQGPDGSLPPNNWQSHFGGPAWTQISPTAGLPDSGSSTFSIPPSQTSTGITPLSTPSLNACCVSGSTAAYTASVWTWPMPS